MFKKLSISPYTLKANLELNPSAEKSVSGLLLKVDFPDATSGYSLYQAWEHLGDPDLVSFQNKLKRGEYESPEVKTALYIALIDAQARAHGKSLTKDFIPIQNYQSIANLENLDKISLWSKEIKWKWPKSHESIENFRHILKTCNSRIDFNHRDPEGEIVEALNGLSIDYIEDLKPEYLSNYCLAEDHNKSYPQKNIFIMKPVREAFAIEDLNPKHRVIFTSYLDHPLGQVIATYFASNFYRRHPDKQDICGLYTHELYQANAYSELLFHKNHIIPAIDGLGFGFDKLLSEEKWIQI